MRGDFNLRMVAVWPRDLGLARPRTPKKIIRLHHNN